MDSLPRASRFYLIVFQQLLTFSTFIMIRNTATKQLSKHYRIPILKGEGASETTGSLQSEVWIYICTKYFLFEFPFRKQLSAETFIFSLL